MGEGRLLDPHGLEATLERRVLLDVLAVLVEGGGADGLQLAAGQHRLQDRCGVDRALGGSRADERVDLVDEQDDVAAGLDLLEHLLQALLEVAAVAGTGDESAEVEGVELLVAQGVRNVVVDDPLGETLDDRGLADAGLTDEHRVVLRAPRQDLHDPLELVRSADHRVELVLTRHLREVAAELVEHLGTLVVVALRRPADTGGLALLGAPTLLRTGRALVAAQQLDDLLADAAEIGSEFHEDLSGDALSLADEAEEDVLGADVVVSELQRLAERELEHLLRPGGEGDVTRRRRPALTDDLLHLGADGLEGDREGLEGLRGDALTLVDEAEEDVLGADVRVIEEASLLLSEHHDAASPVGEAFEHVPPLKSCACWCRSLYR